MRAQETFLRIAMAYGTVVQGLEVVLVHIGPPGLGLRGVLEELPRGLEAAVEELRGVLQVLAFPLPFDQDLAMFILTTPT